ncbi:LAETG motif-containing sortase-dependent surface protein [Streptomyces sp. PmtG]
MKQTVSDIPPTGSLAETGSSSALPAIGLVGGAAVVVGAGAVFVVRRRGNSNAAS